MKTTDRTAAPKPWEAFIPLALRPRPKITHCRSLPTGKAPAEAAQEKPMNETRKAVTAALALAFLVPTSACRAQNTVRQGSFPAGGSLRIEQDKGTLVVEPGEGSAVEYSTEFSGRFWSNGGGSGRVEEDARAGRLGIYAGSDTRAKTVVKVPKNLSLRLGFGDGSLKIGALSGPLNASVANGQLTFDSAGVPQGACVGAKALNGIVRTPWGRSSGAGSEVRPCPKPLVELEVINGTVEVR